jgi:carbonic anhydrase
MASVEASALPREERFAKEFSVDWERMNRRDMVALLGTAGAMALLKLGTAAQQRHATGAAPHSATETSPIVSPHQALERLKAGNERFANGNSRHADESLALRHRLESGQHPFATVLGCSDSRVPVELIFDQGFGDLFVIRVAGNVITDGVIGSIEYARIHLNTQLLVILGHEGCGAVTAALEARNRASSDPHGIQSIVQLLQPATRDVDSSLPMSEQVHRAVEHNVRWAQDDLNKLVETRDLQIRTIGAVYDLGGTVHWLS